MFWGFVTPRPFRGLGAAAGGSYSLVLGWFAEPGVEWRDFDEGHGRSADGSACQALSSALGGGIDEGNGRSAGGSACRGLPSAAGGIG